MEKRKIALFTFLIIVCSSIFAQAGMFDFLKKGMKKSWKTHKEKLFFCNNTLIVVEDGYKLLKIAPKRKRRKNEKTVQEGKWGFKLKIQTASDEKFLSYLNSKYSYDYKRLEKQKQKGLKAPSGSLERFLFGNSMELDSIDSKYLVIQYKLFDADGFFLAESQKSISREDITSFLNSRKNGFIEVINEGVIPLEDIERVAKREIIIDYNVK